MGAVRIVLVDDHSLCRTGLSDLLRQRGGMDVVAALSDPDQVLAVLREQRPDLVVLDLRMPGTDGLTLLQRIRAEGLDTPAVILTMSDSENDLAAALRAGVRGYLLKDMEPEQLLGRVRDALEGRTVISDTLTAALASALRDEARGERRDVRDLTDRELAVLKCLAGGQSNKVIARNLSITEGTVKVHVKHLLKKLGFRSRVEAAVWASEQGLRVAV